MHAVFLPPSPRSLPARCGRTEHKFTSKAAGPATARFTSGKRRQAAYSCPTAWSSRGHAASWNGEQA